MKLKLLLLIIAFTFCGTTVNAQSSGSNISVALMPSYPAPYEDTTITLTSYLYNLDSVLISWSVDGKKVASGTGKKSFSVNAPAAGKETNVTATIYLPNGLVETKIAIKPLAMVLLWQANDSYVPPFYKGKALASPDSEIKIVAMPEAINSSGIIDSKNMVYAWKKDYTNNVDGSGYGKNFFLYISDYLEDLNNVSVTASTVDQKYSSQASIDVGTTEPKILFYKNDSVLGTIWEKTLADTHKIQGSEIVEAAPYFISPKELRTPSLIWSWSINGDVVDLKSFNKSLMPLSAAEGTHGNSKLKLDIQNRYKLFQAISKEINIEF